MRSFLCLTVAFALVKGFTALDNGLGRTPQMGWNSWNHFSCGINATIVKDTADAIVSGAARARSSGCSTSLSVFSRFEHFYWAKLPCSSVVPSTPHTALLDSCSPVNGLICFLENAIRKNSNQNGWRSRSGV